MAFVAPLIAAIGPEVAAAGTAAASAAPFISAAGSVVGGVSSLLAGNYSAQVARNNAAIANANADRALAAGSAKAERQSMKGAAIGGKIKAAQAANNVDVNTGSAADVQESERAVSKLDTETTMSNAQLDAYGYRSQATNFKAQAGLDEFTGISGLVGSLFKAGGGLLGNASATGSNFNFSQIGTPSLWGSSEYVGPRGYNPYAD